MVSILTGSAYVALVLRAYIPLSWRTSGADDWCLEPSAFLVLGRVINSIWETIRRVGLSDALLSSQEQMDGPMWWTLFTVFHCSGIMSIKLNIGFTMERRYRLEGTWRESTDLSWQAC